MTPRVEEAQGEVIHVPVKRWTLALYLFIGVVGLAGGSLIAIADLRRGDVQAAASILRVDSLRSNPISCVVCLVVGVGMLLRARRRGLRLSDTGFRYSTFRTWRSWPLIGWDEVGSLGTVGPTGPILIEPADRLRWAVADRPSADGDGPYRGYVVMATSPLVGDAVGLAQTMEALRAGVLGVEPQPALWRQAAPDMLPGSVVVAEPVPDGVPVAAGPWGPVSPEAAERAAGAVGPDPELSDLTPEEQEEAERAAKKADKKRRIRAAAGGRAAQSPADIAAAVARVRAAASGEAPAGAAPDPIDPDRPPAEPETGPAAWGAVV
jgi:hypothetical protein